ncbi:MAG: 30S ribosomal protein S9, partial [Ignavibacteria bacterium]|nr:30S ribosomal protein S9 [Ignavibacteria bacterium]
MADQIFVGRRKTAVARVILRSGNGTITVNGKAFEQAFPEAVSREDILGPFIVTD